jgi:hypothetical protein
MYVKIDLLSNDDHRLRMDVLETKFRENALRRKERENRRTDKGTITGFIVSTLDLILNLGEIDGPGM